MGSRAKEDSNLLRSHYYLLVKKYQYSATPLRVNKITAYLHKGSRGYSYNHFTHTDFKSLIRILGFKFFNFKFVNLKSIISKCNNWKDCEYLAKKDEKRHHDSLVIINQEIPTKMNKYMNDEFLIRVDTNKFQERNLGLPLDGTLPIIEVDGESLMKNSFDVISFYKYINNVLKSNVSYILQNCITSVYKELNYKYEFYKIHKNLNLFQMDILPTPADYIIAFRIFDYIENIHNIPEKYKHPSMIIQKSRLETYYNEKKLLRS